MSTELTVKSAYFAETIGSDASMHMLSVHIISQIILVLSGVQWANPGGTAIPGQPMTEPEQAPELYPLAKISLISKGGHASHIRY